MRTQERTGWPNKEACVIVTMLLYFDVQNYIGLIAVTVYHSTLLYHFLLSIVLVLMHAVDIVSSLQFLPLRSVICVL